jgi:hypothetical protein
MKGIKFQREGGELCRKYFQKFTVEVGHKRKFDSKSERAAAASIRASIRKWENILVTLPDSAVGVAISTFPKTTAPSHRRLFKPPLILSYPLV